VLLAATLLALSFSALLFQSQKIAIVAFVLGLGMTVIFLEPFVGLLNYLIFLYVRPQEFIMALVGTPVMMILGAMTIAFTILHMALKRNPLGLSRAPQNYLMLWFMLAIAMSHLANVNLHGATESMRKFLPTFMLFFMITTMITTQRRLRVFFYLLSILTVFLAGQGIYQYYTGVGIAGQELFQGRIVSLGIFSDPNDMALALLIVLPFCFREFTERGPIIRRAINLVFTITIITTVFMTDSRGGILSLGVLTLFVTASKLGWKVGLAVGAIAFAGIFVLGPSRMGTISTDESSGYARIEAWTVALELVRSRPIFGVGAQMFTDYHVRTAHNSYLLCVAELGMFGLFAWVMLIILSIKNMHYISRYATPQQNGRLGLYADAIKLGLIGFLCASMFLSRTYIEMLFILLAMSVSVTTIFVRNTEGKYKLVEKRDWQMGLLISIGGLIFMKFFLIWAW
ncbi:MAG: O-antigen ligase family protein, partial [Candidatus Krumholzibacteria bacterium]|nr:O-antigen ligase family protein [Candidatus Krumholzibacteria bacterium]